MSYVTTFITLIVLLSTMVGPYRRLPKTISHFMAGKLGSRDALDFYIFGRDGRPQNLSKGLLFRRIFVNFLENAAIAAIIIGGNIFLFSHFPAPRY